MALIECRKKTTTIGNVYAEVGDVEVTTTVGQTTKVTLGWQPDEVWIMQSNQPFDSNTAPSTFSFSATTLKDNNKAQYIAGSPGSTVGLAMYSLPPTSSVYSKINSIDSDGFTLTYGVSNRKYCRYIAYKFKE